jgi:hypothetical protein
MPPQRIYELLIAVDEARYLGGDIDAAMEDLRSEVHGNRFEAWGLKLEGCERTIKRHLGYIPDAQN